jgi:hypothetical protein
MKNRSVFPGIGFLFVFLLFWCGILALGRFLPEPIPWVFILAPLWLPPIFIALIGLASWFISHK